MYTHVSLDDRTDTQREHRRQLSRERKRRQRQRQGDGIKHVAVYYGPVVVEAYINGRGEVYDYRIVSGPVDDTTRSQVVNLLLWSHFAPARFFGQPVRGLAVLSFSGVSVRG